MKRPVFLFVVATAFFACSQSNGPAIHADLYARYEQGDQKLKAEATFYQGEAAANAQSVVFQNGVGFLGSGMLTRELPGGVVRYEIERTLKLPENIPVHFTDDRGKEINIALQIPSIRDFDIQGGTVQKNGGFTMTFDASPLADHEKLVLVLTDALNQSHTLEIKATAAQREITFAPGQLSKLAAGKLAVYLVRTGNFQKKEGRFVFDIQTAFYSKTKWVEVEGN